MREAQGNFDGYVLRKRIPNNSTAILRTSHYQPMVGSPIEASSLEVDEPLDPAKASPKLLENLINEGSTFSHGVFNPNFEEYRLFESPDSTALLLKSENLLVHQETSLPL